MINGARLELLDWGGKGDLLLFLPGYGNSAHIFDDLAPEFTTGFHVVALTPRGFAPSSAPASGYTIHQLADDVRSVLDSLHARKATLAGHSISGAVITEFGMRYPARLAGAIYLEAAIDYAAAFERGHRAGRPVPPDTTMTAFRTWAGRYSDSLLPAGVRKAIATDESIQNADSANRGIRTALTSALVREVRSRPHEPWRISAPALSVCAEGSFDRAFGWAPSAGLQREAFRFFNAVTIEKRRECRRFGELGHNVHIVELDGDHYIFLTSRDQVVHAMWDFLLHRYPAPPTGTDSAGVINSLVRFILASGDPGAGSRGIDRIVVSTDFNDWSRRAAAAFIALAPDSIRPRSDSAAYYAFNFEVDSVVVKGDSATVEASFGRCMIGRPGDGMNWWRHPITYRLARRSAQWATVSQHLDMYLDGVCQPYRAEH